MNSNVDDVSTKAKEKRNGGDKEEDDKREEDERRRRNEQKEREVALEAQGEASRCIYHVNRIDPKTRLLDLRLILPSEMNNKVLCSNRVSQMTKTYNDIEAVTRLLEEKEKDVELTARIGKELLINNQKLEHTVATLENELKNANEKITQLTHELNKKSELIQILTNDVEDFCPDDSLAAGAPAGSVINMEMLQHKIGKLERENTALRSEASLLAAQTDEVEQEEQRLVSDFSFQLSSLRSDLSHISEEADRYREESRVYKQLSASLEDKLAQTEDKLSTLKAENEEMTMLLVVTRDTQNELALELADLKERYAEVVALLQETQQLLKKQKKKSIPVIPGGSALYSSFHSSGSSAHDSLGTELECSLFSELSSTDSGISADRATPHYKKVFETVKTASRLSNGSSSQIGDESNRSGLGSAMTQSMCDSAIMTASYYSRRSRTYTTSSSQRNSFSYYSDDYSDSERSEDSAYPNSRREGIPGAPGSVDLAEALKKLTPAAVYARRAALSSDAYNSAVIDSECRTPDSIMSAGSFGAPGAISYPHSAWKLPEKLQIVKPIEGSATLHHWSKLATPSLGGLFEERPGIKTRGGIELEDLGIRMFSLADVEEDDEGVVHPGKSFQPSGTVYTFTNSTVMHPDDGTASISSSLYSSRMSTVSNSRASTAPPTPLRSRRNSTCTFSVTLGLAKLLNERGITAATPSTLVTPSFTPTATPCNSPEGGSSPISTSPSHSRSSSPTNAAVASQPFAHALGFPGYLVSSGAEYLRKTLTGSIVEQPSSSAAHHKSRVSDRKPVDETHPAGQCDKKTFAGIRLMETVEKMGVESFVSNSVKSVPDNNQGKPGNVGPESSSNTDRTSNSLSSSSLGNRGRRIPPNGARIRPDLGTVLGSVPVAVTSSSTDSVQESAPSSSLSSFYSSGSSTLGTLSSMLFGRKGGLL